MTLLEQLISKIENKEERIIEIRRYLHQHPELSFQEKETSKYIKNFYKDLDIDHIETDLGGQYGHVITIKGGQEGPTIALRADFDALPITEEVDLPFKSKNNGVMHACGHDGHTAYMLILAESLIELKDQIKGTIKILHQPAEEVPPGGAKAMIKAGALENVDYIFGAHVMSQFKLGTVYTHEGNTQTARAYFKLTIKGKSGHGSAPHDANDAIVAASSFVMNAQTVVSRRVNPFDMGVLSIGSFDGKGQFNIIRDKVVLEGDVRSMSEETAKTIQDMVTQLAKGLEESFQVETELEYKPDYPVLYNDPAVTKRVTSALESLNISDIKAVEDSGPISPSEDFSYYLKEVPGCFFYIGANEDPENSYPHHHPKFEIDEKSLKISAISMAAVVDEFVG
ncbi:M20 family metallopeptidase [Facklamia sp. P12945]|uniref:M20 family metallopeptidase n=1 Tax=unclassified Facklamia TaxID=2622293 RepID=UPI003D16C167